MSGWSEPLYVTSGKTPGGQRRNFQTKGLGSVVVFFTELEVFCSNL